MLVLKQAWRSVVHRATTVAGVVLVAGVGGGLLTAVFAVVDPILFRSLPFPDGDGLVVVSVRGGGPDADVRPGDWLKRSDLFADGAELGPSATATLAVQDGFQTLRLASVSSRFWAMVGYPLLEGDWRRTGPSEIPLILTHGGAAVLGAHLRSGDIVKSSDATTYRVAGVLPEGFVNPIGRPGGTTKGFVPIVVPLGDGPALSSSLLVKLQDGVTPVQVESALSAKGSGAVDRMVAAIPLRAYLTQQYRSVMFLLMVGSVIVAAVCITNVASLLAGTFLARASDMRTRQALGASARDLWGLVLAELTLVGVLCAAGIVLIAQMVLVAFSRLAPDSYNVLGDPTLGPRVVGAALVTTAVMVSTAAAVTWGTISLGGEALVLRVAMMERRRGRVVRRVMTVSQVSIAVALVVCAALLSRSLLNLVQQDSGVDRGVLVMSLQFRTPPAQDQIKRQVDALRSLPGVADAASTPGPIVDGGRVVGAYRPPTLDGQPTPTSLTPVGDRFFLLVGASVREGRLPLGDSDFAVANLSYARSCCPGGTPVGRTIAFGRTSHVITAVVDDIYMQSLDERPGPTVFVPSEDQGQRVVSHLIKLNADAPASLSQIEAVIRSDPGVELRNTATLRARYMTSVMDRVTAASVSVLFALAALSVAATGIFATTAALVERRCREFAVRLAVGASPGGLRRQVLKETSSLFALGAAVGVIFGIFAARAFDAFLYGISPLDPVAVGTAIGVCLAAAVAAAWIPSRRLKELSPTLLLRLD